MTGAWHHQAFICKTFEVLSQTGSNCFTMKQTLIIFLFTLTTNSVFACLSASQNRLFPLGQTSEGLCVVETHLDRTEFREKGKEIIEMKPAWEGISYFKIYDRNYNEIYCEPIDTLGLFEQRHYDSILNIVFAKGLLLAENYPDFIAAEPISITFCDYQKMCSNAGLYYDMINDKISIGLPNESKYEVKVLFDSASIASNLLNYIGGFGSADFSVKSFEGNLYINSVRTFHIDSKKLTVVHIGTGQNFELNEGGTYPPGEEYTPIFSFTDIHKSVFEEPVLHHGLGFDFYIWE